MPQYRYKKIVTEGAYGHSVMHKNEDGVFTLGDLGGYTYISADNLDGQPEILEFESVVVSGDLKQSLYEQMYLKQAKLNARGKIRGIKDFEDDLTDLKQVVQFMARGFAGLWVSLPQEVKDANSYKANFDLFATAIENIEFRLDLENDQVAKISKILQDEAEFATIVKDEYLSKL